MGSSSGHVFISYVREDSVDVDWLQWTLKSANLPVWRDTADLWPGEDWRLKIRQAISENALVFIACFSSRSFAKQRSYQNEELLLAIEQLRMRRPDNPWLIPVRFDECEIPDLDLGGGRTLAMIQRSDLFGSRPLEATRLVLAIQRILGNQSPKQQGLKVREVDTDSRISPTNAGAIANQAIDQSLSAAQAATESMSLPQSAEAPLVIPGQRSKVLNLACLLVRTVWLGPLKVKGYFWSDTSQGGMEEGKGL